MKGICFVRNYETDPMSEYQIIVEGKVIATLKLFDYVLYMKHILETI